MPLIASLLATQMLSATQNAPTAIVAQTKLGTAISSYIMSNAVVNFAWVGFSPPPTSLPDPVVIATGKIITMPIILTPTPAPGTAALSLQISSGIMAGIYAVDPPFSCATGSMVGFPPIVINVAMMTDRVAIFNKMAQQIVTGILSFIPTIPCAGSHLTFTGTATPTGII